MSQQTLDLRESIRIVRRYKKLIGIFVVLGAICGCAYVVLNPPKMTSEAVIVVPAASPTAMATDVVVAGSDPVLSAALPNIRPPLPLDDLLQHVQVTSLTTSLIQVTGVSSTAAGAESIANAVANSFIAYVGSSNSPIGRLQAQVFESATTANGAGLPGRLLSFGLMGSLGGFLIGFIVVVAINRGDRKLRQRDHIANSIGVPVLASIPALRPGDSAGWTSLLEGYEPGAVDAWRLRRTLDRLGVTDVSPDGDRARRSSLTVISLSSDPAALSLGPQLASFAASLGIRTVLIVGPQQDMVSAATLRTACATPAPGSLVRSRPLRVIGVDGGRLDNLPSDATLVVVVVVVDSTRPQMPGTLRTASTLLGVTAGVATAEELARAATGAAADGGEIVGILVADPDPTDQTTGSVPVLGRPTRRRIPTRITGVPTETRR